MQHEQFPYFPPKNKSNAPPGQIEFSHPQQNWKAKTGNCNLTPIAGMGGMLNLPRRIGVRQGRGKQQRLKVGVGQQANLPKWGRWCGGSWSWSPGPEDSTQNWTALPLCEEPTKLKCSCSAMELLPGEYNSSDHPAWAVSELSKLPIATCPVDRKNTSQSPGVTTSEFLFVCQYQDWTPKGITPETLPNNWTFGCCGVWWFCLFVCLLISFFPLLYY
jgi:hypothetical protein